MMVVFVLGWTTFYKTYLTITDVHALHSGSTLSDHFPLFFIFHLHYLSPPPTVLGSSQLVCIGWYKTIVANVKINVWWLSQYIGLLPSNITNCVAANCTQHQAMAMCS